MCQNPRSTALRCCMIASNSALRVALDRQQLIGTGCQFSLPERSEDVRPVHEEESTANVKKHRPNAI